MTKNPEFQKELNKKVKPGIKPSHLKKSKSADDISTSLPVTNNSDPPTALLQEQLAEKQKEVENLRKDLETKVAEALRSKTELQETNQKLTETTNQLDKSLEARQQNLKDWTKLFAQVKSLRIELEENVDQASEEINDQEQVMTDLRSRVQKLKSEKQNLVRDLNLAQRLAESRKYPLPSPAADNSYLKYALYSLCTVGFTLWLTNNLRKEK